MNKPVLEKSERILIIGETEDETRRVADALAGRIQHQRSAKCF